MEALRSGSHRVIGLGNSLGGDDALGAAVIARLRCRAPEVDARTWDGDVLGLLEAWDSETTVVLVDAVISGAPPGTLHRLDARATTLPAHISCHSTHSLGLSQGIELARALRRLPRRLVIVGIEAGATTQGAPPTQAAWCAIDAAVDMVLREIQEQPAP